MTMKTVCTVDPERITLRLFGGPYFRFFEERGNVLVCPKTGHAWRAGDIAQAWAEGKDIPALVT